jgi:hypothetical protein
VSGSDGTIADVDAAWIGAISAIGGASATGLVDWLRVTSDNRSKRREAEAQREHEAREAQAKRDAEAAEHNAQRENERRAALRAERAKQIREWQEGLRRRRDFARQRWPFGQHKWRSAV